MVNKLGIFIILLFTTILLIPAPLANAQKYDRDNDDHKYYDRDGKKDKKYYYDRDGKRHDDRKHKDGDRKWKRSYDIKVTIKNPDRLDTERDVKVRTSIDSDKEEIDISKKSEKIKFKNIKGYSGNEVKACIEGSKYIRGDCETERLPHHDDSVSIKLKIERK